MKEEKLNIVHYSLDLKSLLKTQDQAIRERGELAEARRLQGIENKKRMLKYVLPYCHGIFELHNNKCTQTPTTSTGETGLLGLSKVDTQHELNRIAEGDYGWSENFSCFEFNRSMYLCGKSKKGSKIWLNQGHKHKATPHLEYSMTSIFDSAYGLSIEDELMEIAKACSIYKDNWK